MTPAATPAKAPEEGLLRSLGGFAGDLARYGGRRAVGASLLVGVGALVESLGLVLLVPIISVVVDSHAANGAWRAAAARLFALVGASGPFEELVVLLSIYAVLMLVRAVVLSRRDVTLAQLQIGYLQSQRGQVTELLAGARWDQLAGLRHARVTNVLSGDIQRISSGANFLIQSVVAAMMLAAQCALAFVLSPALAAVALAFLAIIAVALAPMARRSQALGRHVAAANLTLLDSATQFLGGLKLAISQNLQDSFANGFRETLETLARRQVENVREQTYARLALTLLSSAVGALIVLVGFGLLHTPAPLLITLLLIISRMSGPLGQIQQGLQQVAYALPAFRQVTDLKAELIAFGAPPTPSPRALPEGPVTFHGVTFAHRSEAGDTGRGVRDLTLSLAPGSFVGVVGPSGSGKTTFADLLVGLLAPQQGLITVGGAPLEGATLAAWRAAISYVSQDAFLFHDTIRANLAWANPEASEAEMWSALALAGAEALVRRLDHGLDTVVGERGGLVSGGERQRIALARALLRKPRLLVLDEATNAIDVPAERTLIERLRDLAPRPTIVMIAHRTESLAACRPVMRFDQGRLADVLLADDGSAAAS